MIILVVSQMGKKYMITMYDYRHDASVDGPLKSDSSLSPCDPDGASDRSPARSSNVTYISDEEITISTNF